MRQAPRYTRTDTHIPYTTLVRSEGEGAAGHVQRGDIVADQRPDDPDAAAGRQLRRGVVDEVEFHGRGAAEAVDEQQRLGPARSEEHTSELQSLMRNSYAVFCLHK